MKLQKDFSTYQYAITLIELLVVIFVIVVIVTMGAWAIPAMRRDVYLTQGINATRGILAVAQLRSYSTGGPYGVFFYINQNNRQAAIYIEPDIYPPEEGASVGDSAQRFKVVANWIHEYGDGLRIAPIEVLDWNDDNLKNEDYRDIYPPVDDVDYEPGKVHRNFFTLIFDKNGLATGDYVIVHDRDKDLDGIGDTSGLIIGEVLGYAGGTLKDILIDHVSNRLEFDRARGLMMYDDIAFREIPKVLEKRSFLLNNYVALLVTRQGQIVTSRPKNRMNP